MRVLLLGATGNLGSRLIPALLTHGHQVVAYVRSSKKLDSLLPESVSQQIMTVQGDATESALIKNAIFNNKCDAVVSAAGLAAAAPWGKSDLPVIFQAVLDAVVSAGEERKSPLRVWFLGGMSALYYPGTKTMVSNYIPVYLEHRHNSHLLRTLPPDTVDWSMFCPANMTSESSDLSVPTKTLQGKLVGGADTLPQFATSWISYIPLIGRAVVLGTNFARYEITLEQASEFISSDLESLESRWVGMTVGIIDGSK